MSLLINDINIESISSMMTPKELIDLYPLTKKKFIYDSRETIRNIIDKRDNRKIVVVGPCSIHNIDEAKEYAINLKKIQQQVSDRIFIIMRVYFEKPRTTIGWKGLINDPDLNGTCNVNKGLKLARNLLTYLAELEIPAGCEFLDTFIPQYISDLISWGAIGARTTESQNHRQLSSGLSMPIGFKNGTSGTIDIAIDAIKSAKHKHNFYGIDKIGNPCTLQTKGNSHCHIILRGGKSRPNYYLDDVNALTNVAPIMIDCSHDNSKKDYKNQETVLQYCLSHYLRVSNVFGFMLESNINEGKQSNLPNCNLKYGISITDSCINLETTKRLITRLYDELGLI